MLIQNIPLLLKAFETRKQNANKVFQMPSTRICVVLLYQIRKSENILLRQTLDYQRFHLRNNQKTAKFLFNFVKAILLLFFPNFPFPFFGIYIKMKVFYYFVTTPSFLIKLESNCYKFQIFINLVFTSYRYNF